MNKIAQIAEKKEGGQSRDLLMLVTLLLLAANLRACITGVGSLVPIIRVDLGISNTLAGLITTLPLVVFAVVSPLAAKASRRFGFGKAILGGLLALLVGEAIRSYTNTAGLFLGTALMAVGIALGNVLLVSLIKFRFPDRVGSVTGLYSTAMALSASISVGVSVPVAVGLGLGWRNALAMWILLVLVCIVLWIIQLPQLERLAAREQPAPKPDAVEKPHSVYRSALAWQFAAFFGLQSFLFYALSAWIPSILQTRGYSIEEAAGIAFLLQLFNLPSTFLVPILSARCRDQRLPMLLFGLLYLFGMILFFFSGTSALTYISIILSAIGMGSGLGFGNIFISLRTQNAQDAAALSGMGQSVGYAFAAIGPVLLGFVFDLTGSWTLPLFFVLCGIILMTYFGLQSARDRFVVDRGHGG